MTDSAAIAELIARARQVKKETADSANTAFRVGSLIEDLINALSSGAEIDLDKIRAEIEALESNKADRTELPTKVSQLENDVPFITKQEVDAELSGKVDKVSGSSLMTDAEHSKLSGIETGAQKNVHPDWNATSGDALILNKPTIPSIEGLATKTYVDSQDAKKLDSIYQVVGSDNYNAEYNVAYSASSNGKVCLGIFPCYDTNVTIEVSTTTNKTFNGTIVLATQNINTTGGGTYKCSVYGDYDKALTDTIRLRYKSGSNNIAIYAQFPGWSKNTVHIKAVRLKALPTNILTSVSSIPSDATIKATNVANDTFALKSSIPTLTSQLTNDSGFVTEDKLEDYLLKKDHIPYDDIIALFGT